MSARSSSTGYPSPTCSSAGAARSPRAASAISKMTKGPMNDAVQTRTWRRFTPAQRLARFTAYLAIVAAVVVSIRTIEVIPEFLSDAPEQIADLLSRMWPIDFAYYPQGVHAALMETIHIASLGTLLSLMLALPVGVLAAHNLCPFAPVNLLAKL